VSTYTRGPDFLMCLRNMNVGWPKPVSGPFSALLITKILESLDGGPAWRAIGTPTPGKAPWRSNEYSM